MRTAIDEIIDLNLDEKKCEKIADEICDTIRYTLKMRKENKTKKKDWLRLYYALESVREDIEQNYLNPKTRKT